MSYEQYKEVTLRLPQKLIRALTNEALDKNITVDVYICGILESRHQSLQNIDTIIDHFATQQRFNEAMAKSLGLECILDPVKNQFLETPLSEYLSTRTANKLSYERIYLVKDLINRTRDSFAHRRGVGPIIIDEVDKFLETHNLKWREI